MASEWLLYWTIGLEGRKKNESSLPTTQHALKVYHVTSLSAYSENRGRGKSSVAIETDSCHSCEPPEVQCCKVSPHDSGAALPLGAEHKAMLGSSFLPAPLFIVLVCSTA